MEPSPPRPHEPPTLAATAGSDRPPDDAFMLVSRARGRTKRIDARKTSLGGFYTSSATWLLPQVEAFLRAHAGRALLDPFAGRGDLLAVGARLGFDPLVGFDLDPGAGWTCNDSLARIPAPAGAAILTNPPYLAAHSARRKGVHDRVASYYALAPARRDLYQVALDRCLEASDVVVALVPETFLGSAYPRARLRQVTILEASPFRDTQCPVCVVAFDGRASDVPDAEVFRGARSLGPLAALEALRLRPTGAHRIRFNVTAGRVALRAVDLPSPGNPIRFLARGALDYDPARVKVSSRLVTYLECDDVADAALPAVIAAAEELLASYRRTTGDVVLSPFKGNTLAGTRRRRLDYATARALLERAIDRVVGAVAPATPTPAPARSG